MARLMTYEIQIIQEYDGKTPTHKHYRITHSQSDNRVATCYLKENAVEVCEALNFYTKYKDAISNGIIIDGLIVEK